MFDDEVNRCVSYDRCCFESGCLGKLELEGEIWVVLYGKEGGGKKGME